MQVSFARFVSRECPDLSGKALSRYCLCALAYYVTVVYGTVTLKYGLSAEYHVRAAFSAMSYSLRALPLWWKFLQTLRESYDTSQRWPYLGNECIQISDCFARHFIRHDASRPNFWWILSFMVTLLYQIWGDTILWTGSSLSFFAPKQGETLDVENTWCRRIFVGSTQQLVRIAVPAAQHISTSPGHCLVCPFVPPQNWKQVKLRPRRLYKSDAFFTGASLRTIQCCSSGLDAVLHSVVPHVRAQFQF